MSDRGKPRTSDDYPVWPVPLQKPLAPATVTDPIPPPVTPHTEESMATKGTKARPKGRPFATSTRVMSKGSQARYAAMNAAEPVVTQAELVAELEKAGANLTRTSVGFILNGGWYNETMVQVFCRLTGTRPSHVWPEFVDERGNVREHVKRQPSGRK